MIHFSKVNANLIRASGFESAFELRVIADRSDGCQMSDRSLTVSVVGANASKPITAVSNQPISDGLSFHFAGDDAEITPQCGVGSKLGNEFLLSVLPKCEDQNSAGFAINAMDRQECNFTRRIPVSPFPFRAPAARRRISSSLNQPLQAFFERRREIFPLLSPSGITGMTQSQHSRRFVDDD
jgi:hypothetical protein